jgi:hypothetical protein
LLKIVGHQKYFFAINVFGLNPVWRGHPQWLLDKYESKYATSSASNKYNCSVFFFPVSCRPSSTSPLGLFMVKKLQRKRF